MSSSPPVTAFHTTFTPPDPSLTSFGAVPSIDATSMPQTWAPLLSSFSSWIGLVVAET